MDSVEVSQQQAAATATTYQTLDATNREMPAIYQQLSTSEQENASKATYVNVAH